MNLNDLLQGQKIDPKKDARQRLTARAVSFYEK
jgi:hypothetical protein